jgi:uncharacterized protein YecE (DUF72 family)
MPNILVGTASWTDKSLIACGKFYPRGCSSAEDRLRYYASHFPLVEVDSSYYAMPQHRNSVLWCERTPPNFQFNVKAFRALTQHQTPHVAMPPDLRAAIGREGNVYYKDLPADVIEELWRRYIAALQPLAEAGKLGAVHFQFPPWFTARRENYAYLEHVRQRLADFTVAVEFRHQSWFADTRRDATLQFERDHRFVNVIVDEPQGHASSVPAIWEVTHPSLAILRLHGRNSETWAKKGLTASSERFNYDYTPGELEGFVAPIRGIAARIDLVQVIFNNNLEDQGQRNAATVMALLGDDAVAPERDGW